MKYLVDTNILSEQMKPKPDVNILRWLSDTPKHQIYTSVFVIGEIRKGIDIISAKQHPKADILNNWLINDLIPWFDVRILDGTLAIANKWGILRASNRQFKDVDAILAATCLEHDCVLITRNEKDFCHIENLKILNLFQT